MKQIDETMQPALQTDLVCKTNGKKKRKKKKRKKTHSRDTNGQHEMVIIISKNLTFKFWFPAAD
jgi:hypothetical protein